MKATNILNESMLYQLGLDIYVLQDDFLCDKEILSSTDKPEKNIETQEVKNNPIDLKWILLGNNLDSIWQNDESLEWSLWQKISQAFDLSLEQTQFFDTALLSTNTAVDNSFTEILSSSVEFILVEEEQINNLLVKKLSTEKQIISVPSLSEMLSSRYAKKKFYTSMLPFK